MSGRGVGALSTNQKNEPAGAPFTAGSAVNGTSIDALGRVVLGNDTGGVAAALLSNREIPCGAFQIDMNGDNTCLAVTVSNAVDVPLNGITVVVNANDGGGVARATGIEATVNFANLQDAIAGLFVPAAVVEHFNNGNAVVIDTSFDTQATGVVGITMINGNLEPFIGISIRDTGAASYDTFIGVLNAGLLAFQALGGLPGLFVNMLGVGVIISPDSSDLNFSGATLDVKGPITLHRFVSPEAASPVAVSATLDNYKVFTNDGAAGAITFNLPAAVAGLTYTFYVQNANGVVIDAAAGDTIRILALVSAAGGNVSSVTIGSAVTLVAINSTEWVAISALGTWV